MVRRIVLAVVVVTIGGDAIAFDGHYRHDLVNKAKALEHRVADQKWTSPLWGIGQG